MATLYRVSWRIVMTLAVLFVLGASAAFAQWTEITSLPTQRVQAAVAYQDGKIYVFGGISPTAQETSSLMLDVSHDAIGWTTLASMSTPRWGACAASVNGKIYIVGGIYQTSQGYSFVANVAEYNPATNTFTQKAAIPLPAAQMSATVVDGKIYVFGGLSLASGVFTLISTVQVYDPATDTWTQAGPGPSAGEFTMAASIGSNIYLMGGDDGTTEYPNSYRGTVSGGTISWAPFNSFGANDIPRALSAGSAGVLNGKIYVAGGHTGGVDGATNFAFDPATKKWTSSFSLPVPVSLSNNLVGDGTSALYLISGNGNPKNYKFVAGAAKAIASVATSDIVMTIEKGKIGTGNILVENKGTLALTLASTIPSTASWLTADAVSVPAGQTSPLTFVVHTSSLDVGYYTADVSVATNDSALVTFPVKVHLFVVDKMVAQPTNVVVEEGTGEWCGWCPYGHEVLNEVEDNYPDRVISVSYHGGSSTEPMQFAAGVNVLNDLRLQGFPNAAVQRWMFPHQSFQMMDRGAWAAAVDSVFAIQPMAPVSLKLDNVKYDAAAKKVTATVTLTVAQAIHVDATNKLALTAIITQDSINVPQHKYNPDGSDAGYMDTYYHRHVARAMTPNDKGLVLTVPATALQDGLVTPGTTITQDISLSVNLGTSLPFVPEMSSLVVIAQQNVGTALGQIYQGISASVIGAPAIALAPGTTQMSVQSGQDAVFTTQVNNLMASSQQVMVERVSNQLPSGWQSQVGIDNTYNATDNNGPFTITTDANGSASVQLKVTPSSDGSGTVTLRFTAGSTSIDRVYTVTQGTAGVDHAVTGNAILSLSHYPNPVTSNTNISYEISKSGDAVVEVYTLTGQKITTLVDAFRNAGSYNVDFDASTLPNGVYAVTLTSNGAKVSHFVTVVH